jgi:hypothetical protein
MAIVKWVVKVTLVTDGNEFAAIDHLGSECFYDSWEAYRYTEEQIAAGRRAIVYKDHLHVGTFEGSAS